MKRSYEQLDLFTDPEKLLIQRRKEKEYLDREHQVQKTLLLIKEKYGKNSILKGMNLQQGATAIARNQQIGGHKS